MQTYNQIIKLNRQFADAHYQIKTFGNGEAYNIVLHDKENWFTYPLMWMEDLSQNFNDNEFTYNFRVYFVAQVAQVRDEETDLESTNENEVKSDMIQCAQDLLSFWAKDTTYPELDLIKTGSIQTFTDKFSDRVTGCSVDLKLKQGFRYNKCAIPMSGVTPPPSVVCLPVQISINSVSFAELSSGASLDIPIQYENGTAVGTNVDGVITIPDPITCVDATVTVNGGEFDTVASGGTLDVPIQYVNGSPIGTNVDGIIQIPNPITCADVIVNINGELWAEVPSGDTENIIVRQSTGSTQVGEIQGAYYRIADSVAVLKDTAGTTISSTDIKAEGSANIVAPDSTITVNGGAFDTVVSGGTLDVEVEYETSLDNPIQSIVSNKIIIVDPIVLPTNRIYLRPEPTGEIYVPGSSFYLDGCDSWMIYNNIDPIVQTSSGIPMVIDKSKRWKLIPDNVFGHKFRFTGSTGGYYDPETLSFYDSDGTVSTYASAFPSDYMIDNSTGLGWQTSGGIANFTFENALANVASLSHAGFDDWYLPNLNQLMSVTDYGYNAPLGSTGDFNPIFTGGISNSTKWTSTTIKGLETRVWIVQVIGAVPNNTLKTNITRYIAFRFHFS